MANASIESKWLTELENDLLAAWEKGRDVATTRSLGINVCFGVGPKYITKTYSEFSAQSIADFRETLINYDYDGERAPTVAEYSIGLTKHGVLFSATIVFL